MARVLWKCAVNSSAGKRASALAQTCCTCVGKAMPVVSHSVMPATPCSAKRSIHPSTPSSGTSPSIGQPNTQDSETFTGTLAWRASAITSVSCAKDCARVMRRLARLWVSLADITTLNSSTRLSSARSPPRRLGTNAV
jgi:hypothetical protein